MLRTLCTMVRWIGKGLNTFRLMVTNLFFLIIFIGLIGFISYSLPKQEAPLSKKAPLYVNLDGQLVEKPRVPNPMQNLFQDLLNQKETTEIPLYALVKTIRQAKDDENITGLILNVQHLHPSSLAQISYLGKALKEFKQSKKPIYAYADSYSQAQYYLASFADTIMLSPEGTIALTGFSGYRMYYKDLLDKLEITPHIFRVGTYKSYVEPYIRNDMSPQVKASTLLWMNQLWQNYLHQISQNRHIDVASLTPNEDQLLQQLQQSHGSFAQLYQKANLVDKLASRTEATQILIHQFGEHKHSFNAIDYTTYQDQQAQNEIQDQKQQQNKIAVIVADGEIIDGESQVNMVGGDTIAEQLRKARFDPQIKAVILRVNSPGGSAFASEVIRDELVAVKNAGKPVVASMSGMAASGGYWISVSADKIIAQPNSITGSIGIFGMFASIDKLLGKIGVHTDGVATTPYAGVSITRPLSPKLSQMIQLSVEHGYAKFISLVSQFREMSLTDADKIAQGQVWTGLDAKNNGLVDELGDFDSAIASAKKLAGLKTATLDWMNEPLSPLQNLLVNINNKVRLEAILPLPAFLSSFISTDMQKTLTEIDALNDPNGQYSLCLNCLRIQ